LAYGLEIAWAYLQPSAQPSMSWLIDFGCASDKPAMMFFQNNNHFNHYRVLEVWRPADSEVFKENREQSLFTRLFIIPLSFKPKKCVFPVKKVSL